MKKKGKTLMQVFSDEEKERAKKVNRPGDVLAHKKLRGLWVVAAQMAGGQDDGGTGTNNWPDGHQIVLRKIGDNGQIDWTVPELRFYQSGCFNDDAMLLNPIVVRKLK